MTDCQEKLSIRYSNLKPTNHHQAAIIAIDVFASDLGFILESEDLKSIFEQSSHFCVLRYCSNMYCGNAKFSLKYVYVKNCAVVYAFTETTLVHSAQLNVEEFINPNADFQSFNTVYQRLPEFMRFVKDNYLLKIIAEAQYQMDIPQTFGITLLPLNCLENIFMQLDKRDIAVCTRLNEAFKQAVDSSNYMWRQLYRKDALMRRSKAKKEERMREQLRKYGAKRRRHHNNIIDF